MSVTTKRGDMGKSYWKDKVVDKDSSIMELIGGLDELQAVLGICKVCFSEEEIIKNKIELVQKDLMDIACNLADYACDFSGRIKIMEDEITQMELELPKLTKFIIPGINESESYLNLARTVCRRVERIAVKLSKEETINNNILVYLNRLSDYLFLLTRKAIN